MFALRASECVKLSRDRLMDPPASDDPHSIVFSQFRPEVHEPVRQAMLQPKVRRGQGRGMMEVSWAGFGAWWSVVMM